MIADVSEESNPKALTYAKGIIDEATRWSKEEVDSSVSDSGASSDNSSKIDPTTLFWSRSDKVLVVDDNRECVPSFGRSIGLVDRVWFCFQTTCEDTW